MLSLRRAAPTHEDLFVARFDRLMAWAPQITGDGDRADDLVQDAYLRFTISRPSLDRVQDLDAYLYRILQNLHLSHVRRSARAPAASVSVLDFDSAAVDWRALDTVARLTAMQELIRVCQYACDRRLTSKTGSVLLLRFFHG